MGTREMKVFIDYDINNSGKGKFLQRLMPELEKLGVESRFKPEGCDVALGIARWRTKPDMPKVLRVDGIYLDGDDKRDKWINKHVKKSIERADCVIFQSEFSRKMVNKKLKPKIKLDTVIFNGADPKDYADVESIDTGFKYNIIASAKWCNRHGNRKHKRLKAIISVAKMITSIRNDVKFLIAGKTEEKYNSTKQIEFLGYLEEPMLRRYLKTANVMVYLAKLDWMPNAVIEALCAGTPVICTQGHGVEEVVRATTGIVVNNKIDEAEVIWNINDLLDHKRLVNVGAVHIKNIAKKYKNVFERVL